MLPYPSPSESRYCVGLLSNASPKSEYPSPSESTHPNRSRVEFPEVVGHASPEFPFELSDDDASGDYLVNIMSMCREVHRDICTHKTAETTISVIGEQSKIPDWVRNIFVWYAEDSISEKELLQALQYLIKEKIIQVDDVTNT